jgi:hypothetical protein
MMNAFEWALIALGIGVGCLFTALAFLLLAVALGGVR